MRRRAIRRWVVVGDGEITGTIDILDIRFGSLWTNIPADSFRALGVDSGDFVRVSIRENGKLRYQNQMPFTRTFAGVSVGEPLVYVNSLLNIGVAVNQDLCRISRSTRRIFYKNIPVGIV